MKINYKSIVSMGPKASLHPFTRMTSKHMILIQRSWRETIKSMKMNHTLDVLYLTIFKSLSFVCIFYLRNHKGKLFPRVISSINGKKLTHGSSIKEFRELSCLLGIAELSNFYWVIKATVYMGLYLDFAHEGNKKSYRVYKNF